MTGQPPDDAPRPDGEGLDYRDVRLAELEGELASSLAKIDQLTRRIGQLNAMINNMGRAAQAVRVTRLGIRRPNTLVRLPVDLFRAVAHPVPQPEPPTAGASPEEAERRRGQARQLAAAVRTVERRLEATASRDVRA
ncbi:MAG TPA: hypothetical protein VIR16_11595, partial [Candidatus Limnocylindrales bacterium]